MRRTCIRVNYVRKPFVMNAATALTAKWFPVKERAIATGLATLAQYIGILIAMVVTPMLIVSKASDPNYGSGIDNMLKIYGIKNCNSMKKAFDLLNELGLAYEFHDY